MSTSSKNKKKEKEAKDKDSSTKKARGSKQVHSERDQSTQDGFKPDKNG